MAEESVNQMRRTIVFTVVIIYAVVSGLFILGYLIVHYHSDLRRAFRRFTLSIEEYAHFMNMKWRYSRAIDLEKYVETINYHDLKAKGLDGYKYGHVIMDRDSFERLDSHTDDCTCGGRLTKFSIAELEKRNPNELANDDETCCICLELLKTQEYDTLTTQDGMRVKTKGGPLAKSIKDTDIVMIPCQHYFHAGCLKEWFSPQRRGKRRPLVCPLCRMDIVKCKAFCMRLGLLMSELKVTLNSNMSPNLGSERVSELTSDSS